MNRQHKITIIIKRMCESILKMYTAARYVFVQQNQFCVINIMSIDIRVNLYIEKFKAK